MKPPPAKTWSLVCLLVCWFAGPAAQAQAHTHRLLASEVGAANTRTLQTAEPPWQTSPLVHDTIMVPPGNQPLSQEQAVALALLHSPALQALLAQATAQVQAARASTRPGLLRLSLGKLRQGDEVEIDRSLSLGLLDVLTWPWRLKAANQQIDLLQQQQALDTLNHAQAVRAQWVQAVAAQQRASYEHEVLQAAQAGNTLAQRLQATGQFSAAQAAQEALIEAQAHIALHRAEQEALREREALVRLIGLQGEAARQLRLPDRLPATPQQLPYNAEQVNSKALHQRLDTRLAQAHWRTVQSSATEQALRSVLDIEAGWQRQTSTGQPPSQGPELSFALLSADLGAARRRSTDAQEQAALAQWQQSLLDAESQLRLAWAAYQASHQAALHAQQVLLPLRKQLLGERLKQYNGMLIGPLELLAEARAHTGSVIAAMQAQRDFWLADLALRAAMEGSRTGLAAAHATPLAEASTPDSGGHPGGH